jgi:hypothetical protein
MFTRDPFNVAPHAPRYTQASRLALIAGVTFLALCGWQFAASLQHWIEASAIRDARLDGLHAAQRRTARATGNSPLELERKRVAQSLRDGRQMSWPALFGALESASSHVRDGTSLVTFHPVRQDAITHEFSVVGLASSPAVMTEYLNALAAQPGVAQVHLTTQQPAQGAGADAVRFQFSLVWRQGLEVAAPALVAPPYSMHLDDVREMVRLARSHDMRVEAIDYQTETIAALSLLQRGVALRLVGNYPELRSLLGAILLAVPHASIRDIRIDGGDASPTLKATVKLSLLYQSMPQAGNDAIPRDASADQSISTVRTSGADAGNPFGKLGGSTPEIKVQLAQVPVAVKPAPKPAAMPAAPAQPPPALSPPAAPPLPFVAIGSIQGTDVTDGKQVAFIRQQDQLLVVRAGDAIGHSYRVEAVTPQGIEFTYLPLKQRQTLVVAP